MGSSAVRAIARILGVDVDAINRLRFREIKNKEFMNLRKLRKKKI
jgi:hypothetical protein